MGNSKGKVILVLNLSVALNRSIECGICIFKGEVGGIAIRCIMLFKAKSIGYKTVAGHLSLGKFWKKVMGQKLFGTPNLSAHNF